MMSAEIRQKGWQRREAKKLLHVSCRKERESENGGQELTSRRQQKWVNRVLSFPDARLLTSIPDLFSLTRSQAYTRTCTKGCYIRSWSDRSVC